MTWYAHMRTYMTIGIYTNFDDFMLRTPGLMHIARVCTYEVMNLWSDYCIGIGVRRKESCKNQMWVRLSPLRTTRTEKIHATAFTWM